jgi:RNA:NAD 2'-phosphotransferase (TPT1/KptA family)
MQINTKKKNLDIDIIKLIVENNDKQRFRISDDEKNDTG